MAAGVVEAARTGWSGEETTAATAAAGTKRWLACVAKQFHGVRSVIIAVEVTLGGLGGRDEMRRDDCLG